MSDIRDNDAALEHDFFGILSKAKDRGLSGDTLRNAFEAAYSQLDWRSDDDSDGSPAAEMPQKPRRGRHPIDDDHEIAEMSRLITEKGLTRWAAAIEVARPITGENNNLKSRANRLREKYRTAERHVVFDMIQDRYIDWCREEVDDFLLIQEVKRISDMSRKSDNLIEGILGRIYLFEMSINGHKIDDIDASLSEHMRKLPDMIKKADILAQIKRVKKEARFYYFRQYYLLADEEVRSEFDALLPGSRGQKKAS
jgi:hypothetical protein